MRDILKLGAILMIYSLVAAGALAFVNIETIPQIRQNKMDAEDAARALVLPGMAGGYELKNEGSDFLYWIGYRDAQKSEPGGYIFITRESGYSSTLEIMVGVLDDKITGVKILFQQETPGLGAKTEEVRHGETEPWFTSQFKGKSASDNIRVIKDGGSIDSITGATISSRAVTDAINRGLLELQRKVGGEL